MSLLNEVTGECLPFDDAWLSQLDAMTKEQALAWVQRHLDSTIRHRNTYENDILSKGIVPGLLHVWCIDNNNIIRFKRLLDEIASEE